jgi:hypothetical protein
MRVGHEDRQTAVETLVSASDQASATVSGAALPSISHAWRRWACTLTGTEKRSSHALLMCSIPRLTRSTVATKKGMCTWPSSCPLSARASRRILTDSGADTLLPQVGEILRAEHWGGAWVSGTDPYWTFAVDRGVRRFLGVPNLDAYFRLRDERPRASPPPRFDALFWTAFAAVFAIVAAFLTGIQEWTAVRTLSLLTAVAAGALAVHRRRFDRWTYIWGAVGVMSAVMFGWTFWSH